MDNKIKSKTRLAAIQLVSQQLINKQDIELIKEDFDKHYRNTIIRIEQGLDNKCMLQPNSCWYELKHADTS